MIVPASVQVHLTPVSRVFGKRQSDFGLDAGAASLVNITRSKCACHTSAAIVTTNNYEDDRLPVPPWCFLTERN
jgi:hypothetical protein